MRLNSFFYKIILFFILLTGINIFVVFANFKPIYYIYEGNPDITKQENITKELLLSKIKGDICMGDENARITMIEYSSLSCPHCSLYHQDIFGKIYTNYIATGKIKYIYRDFPTTRSAVAASLVGLYDSTRVMDFAQVFFSNQNLWAFRYDYVQAITDIASLSGLSSKVIKAAINSKDKEEELLMRAFKAADTLGITGTPVFIIDGEVINGIMPYNKFTKMIDAALDKH